MKCKKTLTFTTRCIHLFCAFLFAQCSTAQNSNWYYPWKNNISNLESSSDTPIIPLLIDGYNYRILKIENFSGNVIHDFDYSCDIATVEIFQLPLMENHSGEDILDLILPIDNLALKDNNVDKYFLVRFKGLKTGDERISFSIHTNKKTYRFSNKLKVARSKYLPPVSLNVFAYFDYNFLVKDLKSQVISDLVAHNVDVLVIPPSVIPDLSSGNTDTSALSNYLKKTEHKFRYYILYLNLNDKKIDFNSPVVRRSLSVWYFNVMKWFREKQIPESQVFLFPYDEPKQQQISHLMEMQSHFNSVGIKNPFFVTVDNLPAAKVVLGKIEYVQIQPQIMKQMGHIKTSSRLWSYQLIYGSRDRSATEYRDMSITAFRNNAEGIGVWSYADIDRAVDVTGKKDFDTGRGTWDISYSAPSAEYALVYRKNDTLYSSLRWEALSYGMEYYFWLVQYQNKFGKMKTQELLEDMDTFSEQEIEALKLKIIAK